MPAPQSLPDLEADLRRDLELLDFPARPWSIARTTSGGQPVLDCLVVGAGQGGLAVAFGLLREKIGNLLVVDENPKDRAGPWRTFARMRTLRTPKHLTGPDLGIPSLTFRAWFEAQHGAAAWQALGLVPKEQWADYLSWYRDVLGIPVRHGTRAGALDWDEGERCFVVPLTEVATGATSTRFARTVVLATGIDGSGYWATPEVVAGLPRERWAHTHDPIDFEALRGKRVGILGAGASAFDNASVALESGAASVDLFYRRAKLPNVNPYRWAEFAGFLRHLGDLDDASRHRFIHKILEIGQLPPADTYARARRAGRLELHGGATWERAELAGDTVRVHTTRGESFDFDFLVFGTGFVTDLGRRPELAKIHDRIALWRDCFTPPTTHAHADLARHPYLGPCFEHRDKTGGDAPWLANLFNYTFGCLASLGFGGASISGMKYSVPKVVYGVTRRLFVEDGAAHFDSLAAYRTEEFDVAPELAP
jgi:cation diffusion facilitator CzcD-associated flavoprotein CzcO